MYIPFARIDGGMVLIDRMSSRMPTGGDTYNYAVLIIDDMIFREYDIDAMVDPSNIERIGVLKGTQATILGGDGAGGAIVITTKKGYSGFSSSKKYNIRKISPLGFQKPVEFYSPRYDTPAQRNNWQPDLRTTIYWNPNVIVSPKGEAVFDFYTADDSATYTIIIEGITTEGNIIQGAGKITNRKTEINW
jgi:hypothetical protein